MLGRDHALSGAVIFATAAPALDPGLGVVQLLAGAALTAGAAVLPDIDHPDATISRSFGFLTRSFAWAVEKASGGHRHGTHSLVGVAVFTAGVAAAAAWAWRSSQDWYSARPPAFAGPGWHDLPAAAVTVLLLAAALRALKIGGHSADLIAVGLTIAFTWLDPLRLLQALPPATVVGCTTHIAGDALTHGGCPLLWPFSRREFHLLPRRARFTTGRLVERGLVSPLLLAALGIALARDVHVLRHLWAA